MAKYVDGSRGRCNDARRRGGRVLLRRGHRVPRGVQGGDGGGNRGHHGDASEPPRERVHRDIKSARQTTAPDADNIDLNAVRRFYLDTAERIKQALAPARAASPPRRRVQRWRQEESAMLESHVARSGSQSMREVRYEIIASRSSPRRSGRRRRRRRAAEAWLFFEEEAAEDSASLEARLLPQRDKRHEGGQGARARVSRSSTSDARAPRTPRRLCPAVAGREAVSSEARDAGKRALRRGRAPRRGRGSGAAAQLGARRHTWRAPP